MTYVLLQMVMINVNGGEMLLLAKLKLHNIYFYFTIM